MIDDVFTTVAIQVSPKKSIDYIERSKNLINSVINLTDKDIIVVTNEVEKYDLPNNQRIKIFDIKQINEDSFISGGLFNTHLKRIPISIATELGYKNIMYCDCDTYFEDWDEEAYQKLISMDFDIAFKGGTQLNDLLHLPHYSRKVVEMGELWFDELKKSSMMAEVFILFKNSPKLKEFNNFWNDISKKNSEFKHNTYYDSFYFGVCMYKSKMIGMNFKNHKRDLFDFTKNWKIKHGQNATLDFYGIRI